MSPYQTLTMKRKCFFGQIFNILLFFFILSLSPLAYVLATTSLLQYYIYSKTTDNFSDFLSAIRQILFFLNSNICMSRSFYLIDTCNNG